MNDLGAVLGGQLITVLGQLGYVLAFRDAFERQTDVLRRRPWASFGWGFGLLVSWTLVSQAGTKAAPSLMDLFTTPLFLAAAAGGAVCLSVIVARLLGLDVRERPYLCVALGQALGAALALLPKLAVPLVTLYGCAGIGAIALGEFSGRDRHDARLGLPGLACFVGLTLFLGLAMSRLR